MHEYTDELPINEPERYPDTSHTRVPAGVRSEDYILSELRKSLGVAARRQARWCDQHQGPTDEPCINGLCPSCASGWVSGGRE
jgi:hypothetical protein